ncbi:MAG TPA: zinc ribbon domain-containing protein [Dehalococcoidia bacterium]|nr:zinc ribbon domain-containing protein [Dehalococcoidia bacterium]
MEQTVKCRNCGSENRAGQQFCGACGSKLAAEAEPAQVSCPSCGAQNLAGQQFCGTCGSKLAVQARQIASDAAQQPTARIVGTAAPRQPIEVKPTWGLAWGLWWRMLLLGLLVGGALYLIVLVVMLALGFQLPQI